MSEDPRLSRQAISLMDDASNTVDVSAISVWEVAIKHALGRQGGATFTMSGAEFLAEVRNVGIAPIPVSAEHAAAVDLLPMHHRDPFDRLLIAQARSLSMHFLTQDKALAAYGDLVLVV